VSEELEINAHMLEMTRCISSEEGIMGKAQAKLDRNQGILDKTTTMCDSFHNEY